MKKKNIDLDQMNKNITHEQVNITGSKIIHLGKRVASFFGKAPSMLQKHVSHALEAMWDSMAGWKDAIDTRERIPVQVRDEKRFRK